MNRPSPSPLLFPKSPSSSRPGRSRLATFVMLLVIPSAAAGAELTLAGGSITGDLTTLYSTTPGSHPFSRTASELQPPFSATVVNEPEYRGPNTATLSLSKPKPDNIVIQHDANLAWSTNVLTLQNNLQFKIPPTPAKPAGAKIKVRLSARSYSTNNFNGFGGEQPIGSDSYGAVIPESLDASQYKYRIELAGTTRDLLHQSEDDIVSEVTVGTVFLVKLDFKAAGRGRGAPMGLHTTLTLSCEPNNTPSLDLAVSKGPSIGGTYVGRGIVNKTGKGQTTDDELIQVIEAGGRYFEATNTSDAQQRYRFQIIDRIRGKTDPSLQLQVRVNQSGKLTAPSYPSMTKNGVELNLGAGETVTIGVFYKYRGKYILFDKTETYPAQSGQIFLQATSVANNTVMDQAGIRLKWTKLVMNKPRLKLWNRKFDAKAKAADKFIKSRIAAIGRRA